MDVPVTMHYKFQQSSPILQWKVPQIPFIDRVLDSAVFGWSSTCPLLCKRQGLGQTVEKTVVPQLLSSDKVVDVPGVPVVQILRCRCGGDSRLPQLQLLRNPSRFRTCSWTRSLTCPLLSTTGYCTVEVPQYSSSPVFLDIPVVQHRRVRCFQHFCLWR